MSETKKPTKPGKSAPKKTASKKAVPPQKSATTPKTASYAGDGKDVRPVPFDTSRVTVVKMGASVGKTESLNQVIAEAEQRKLILQTEAAINLGIGFVLKSFGQSEIAVNPEALKNFTAKYCVAQHVADDGSFLIEVKERV